MSPGSHYLTSIKLKPILSSCKDGICSVLFGEPQHRFQLLLRTVPCRQLLLLNVFTHANKDKGLSFALERAVRSKQVAVLFIERQCYISSTDPAIAAGISCVISSESSSFQSDTLLSARDAASVSQNQKMELAGTRPTHVRAPPGAPSPAKLRQTYSRDAFRRRTKSKYRERYRNV